MGTSCGSPVINAANPAGCTDDNGHRLFTDQRGVPRGSSRCDIGAVEAARLSPLPYLIEIIFGKRFIGVFSSEPEAYEAGLRKVGNKPFLIRRVTKEPEQIHLPALNIGTINADLQ